MEEDDIDEEFSITPMDCMYIDFDEEFPLKYLITDPQTRAAEIHRILKYCYYNGIPPLVSSTDSTQLQLKIKYIMELIENINVNINEKQINEAKKYFNKHCMSKEFERERTKDVLKIIVIIANI